MASFSSSFSGAVGGFSVGGVAAVDQPSNWQDRPRDFLWSRKELEAEEVVEKVALRQAEDNHLDEQQRFEELARELELKGLEYETRYLEMLNARREAFINAEIGRLIRLKISNQNIIEMLLIAASV